MEVENRLMQEGRECDIEAELLERGRDRKWEKENFEGVI
jgi:hypothetical protein